MSIPSTATLDSPRFCGGLHEIADQIDGLILGSPNWTGMTGKLKAWMDETGDLWESGDLIGKPGGAFTAGWSPHAGIEATLLQLFHLIVGHGMVIW